MRRNAIICLLLLWAGLMPAQAQLRNRRGLDGDNYHFGYVSGTVGYSMLHLSSADAVSQGQCGGAVGLGYEFRNSGLWTSVGAQLSFHRSSLLLDEYTRDYAGADTQGKDAVFHYRVNQRDDMQWQFVDVPVMVGYYVQGFYVGGGAKLSYALRPKTHSKGTYNLSATNTEYDVTFENMPDRGYTDYDFTYETDNRLNVGVSVIGEVGYDLLSSVGTRSTICHVLKAGLYIEYGLNNFISRWDTPQPKILPEATNATKATVYPYLNTFTERHRAVPFYAGFKLTYLIGGSRTARAGFHHGCMCYQ